MMGCVIKIDSLFMPRLHCGQPAVFPDVLIEMPLANFVRLPMRRRGVYAIWHWDNIYSHGGHGNGHLARYSEICINIGETMLAIIVANADKWKP